MFNRLKIKLTLTTLLLLSAVLFIIFSGMYFLMKGGMERQSELLLNTIAKDERIITPLDIPNAPAFLFNYFFVKVDPSGNFLDISPNLPVSPETAKSLAAEVFKKVEHKGILKDKNYSLSFLKARKNYGYIMVFLDKSSEYSVLNRLILTSVSIGIVSLLLVFLISLYLSNRAIIPIRNSWEKQNAFVADASHELRTPLAVMNSNLEIVLENNEDSVESQSKWLQNVQGEITRMTKLVDDLLFLARADMDEEEMPVSPFDLSRALEQSIAVFGPLCAKKGLELRSNIKPEIIVLGNEGRIKQLTAILLDNAVKYTPQGGIIDLGTPIRENTVEITVSDTGEGIPKEHLGKVFERFYRVDKSRSRNYGGSGLGLSIAKCIVKEHKGSIHVTSAVGKGTTFKVVLPKYNELN